VEFSSAIDVHMVQFFFIFVRCGCFDLDVHLMWLLGAATC
jgi:hypothetical protein